MTPTALDNPNAKGDKPNKVNTDSKHKTSNAVSILEMSGFQVEAVSFEIAIECFDLNANAIETNQRPVIGAIGEEEP